MRHRRSGMAILSALLALTLAGCGLLPTPDGPRSSGWSTPTPGQQINISRFEQAVDQLRAEAGTDEFWELSFASDPFYGDHVELFTGPQDSPSGLRWASGKIEPIGSPARRPQGLAPLSLDEIDVAALLTAAQPIYDKFYECSTRVVPIGFQGQIEIYCDLDLEAYWTLDLAPLRVDMSSEDGLAAALELVARGAPDQFSYLSMSGPGDGEIAMGFAHEGRRQEVTISSNLGMRLNDFGAPSGAIPVAALDPAVLYACAQHMMEISGQRGWFAWGYVNEQGTLRLNWDIQGIWDPDRLRSVTNERCEVLAP